MVERYNFNVGKYRAAKSTTNYRCLTSIGIFHVSGELQVKMIERSDVRIYTHICTTRRFMQVLFNHGILDKIPDTMQ